MTKTSKKVKSVLIAVLAVIFILTAVQSSFANAPKNVVLEYDAASQTLSVAITHPSAAPGWHYIKTVAIKKNGTEASNNTYERQPDTDTYTYTYKVEAKAGDKIEVTATCSLFGHKTVEMTVGGEAK